MNTILVEIALSLAAGALGAYLVYRFYAPKLEISLYDDLLKWLSHRVECLDVSLDVHIAKGQTVIKASLTEWLVREIERETAQAASKTKVDVFKYVASQVPKAHKDLYERLDVLVHDAEANLRSQLVQVLAEKPKEPQLEGVSADKPSEKSEEGTRRPPGGRFYM